MVRHAGIVVGLLAAVACGRARAPVRGMTAPAGAVEWAGCKSESVGPRCRLGPSRRLTIWTALPDADRWRFVVDGRALPVPEAQMVQDGRRMTVTLPEGARALTIEADAAVPVLSLAFDPPDGQPGFDELIAAGKAGDPEAARRLRQLAEQTAGAARGPAAAALGRVLLARGDMDAAEPALRAALAADRAEGRLSDEVRHGSILIWGLVVLRQRFADARAVLAALAPACERFPEGRVWCHKSEGLLAAETNDPRGALASYRAVLRIADRLSLKEVSNDAAEDLAQVFVVLGRAADATTILERLPSKADPCANASLMINRAEALIEVAAVPGRFDEAHVAASIADEQRATAACPDPHRRLLALVDATRHALAIGDAATAEKLAAALGAQPGAMDALAQAWRADVLGRWSLSRRDAARALRHFADEGAIARAAGLQTERLRAEVGKGQALLALGRHAAGIKCLEEAQSMLEQSLDAVPLTEGRGGFLSRHGETARHLVDALVDGGATDRGLAAARFTRTMEIARAARLDRLQRLSPEQRRLWDRALERYAGIRRAVEDEAAADWTRPASALARARSERETRAEHAREALDAAYRLLVDLPEAAPRREPPLAAGELELAFFEGARGWIVFSRTDKGVRARRFPGEALTSAAQASTVLELVSPELAGARRISVLALGRADEIDWHALPWRGAPLVAHAEVVYSLDLPPTAPRPEDAAGRSALIVADPSNDLAATRGEGDFVARALAPWRLARLDGAAATRQALLAALPSVNLFHYAGHVISGVGEAPTAFVLAGGQRVEVGDLLALARVPELVVLSACRAGAASAPRETSTSMTGLAQAFLAAGARAVVAPIRDVEDAEARAFMVSLYGDLGAGGISSPSAAFRRAARETVGKTSQSFRLVVP